MTPVTQWFDAMHDPVHPGFYEVAFYNHSKEIARLMARWDGEKWSYSMSMRPSAEHGDKWRGLAARSQNAAAMAPKG